MNTFRIRLKIYIFTPNWAVWKNNDKSSFMKLTVLIIIFSISISGFSQRLIKTFEGPAMNISSCAISRDGQQIYATGYDKLLWIMDAATGKVKDTLKDHKGFVFCLAYDPAHNVIATAGWDKRIVLWDAATGKKKSEIKGHNDRINALAFSPDGSLLASASDDNTVILWDVFSGGLIDTLRGHTDAVTCVAFSNDGQFIASSGWDKQVIIHARNTGEISARCQSHRNAINSVSFNLTGQYVISGADDNTCIVWDLAAGKIAMKFDYFKSPVTEVRVFPSDRYIFTAENNGEIKIFDLTTKAMIAQFKAHNGAINDLYINPSGTLLLSCGADMKICLWDVSEFMYFECLKAKLAEYQHLKQPKGEFETTEQYNGRLAEFEQMKTMLTKECIAEFELRRKADQAAQDEKILSTYAHVTLKVDAIGTFDADKQEYPITVKGKIYLIKMSTEEARTFKENYAKAQIKAIKRLINGNEEYFNMELIHPVSKTSYFFGVQVKPQEDRYLGIFLSRQPR